MAPSLQAGADQAGSRRSDAPISTVRKAAFALEIYAGDAVAAAPYEDLESMEGGGVRSNLRFPTAYAVDIGTNPDGKVVALGYQATGGHLFIAVPRRDTWEPMMEGDWRKFGAGTNDWTQILNAAEEQARQGYGIGIRRRRYSARRKTAGTKR